MQGRIPLLDYFTETTDRLRQEKLRRKRKESGAR